MVPAFYIQSYFYWFYTQERFQEIRNTILFRKFLMIVIILLLPTYNSDCENVSTDKDYVRVMINPTV